MFGLKNQYSEKAKETRERITIKIANDADIATNPLMGVIFTSRSKPNTRNIRATTIMI